MPPPKRKNFKGGGGTTAPMGGAKPAKSALQKPPRQPRGPGAASAKNNNSGMRPAARNAPRPAPATAGGNPARLPLEKSKGQHLLKNPGVLDKIVVAAGIRSSDSVLEIGPGTGNLTMRVLPLAKKVVAIDVDARMVDEVKKRAFTQGLTNIQVKFGDALKTDLGHFDVCVANLPYQISSPFLFRLLAHRPLFKRAVLMFQKEFADRMMATPESKNYCRLSVNTQLFCKVDKVTDVAPGSFNPPPKVHSTIVKITPRHPQPEVNFQEWDGLVRICFHRKHRMLRALFNCPSIRATLESNFKTYCSLTGAIKEVDFKQYCMEALTEVGLAEKRASDISLEEFFQLLYSFNKRGVHFTNLAPQCDGDTDMDAVSSFLEKPEPRNM